MTWKRIIIEGQETHYEVSHRGSVYNTESEKMLTQTINNSGYPTVTLRLPDGSRSFLVHRLVAFAFIPNDVPERNQVNHINGDKEDNRVSNLEWVTDQENKLHGLRTGLYRVGEDHGRAVNKDEDILTQICLHYLKTSQCPRYMSHEKVQERRDYVKQLVDEYHADGVMYEQLKFCEYWGYERALASYIMTNDYGVPTAAVDRQYTASASGQLRTRVQAFVESLEIKKIQKEKEGKKNG